MLRKRDFLALLSLFVLFYVGARAQDAPKAPRPVDGGFEFFNGGSYLGVQTAEVTRENFAKFGLKEVRGVAVEKVQENSPAAKAGLQDGDVIIRFNGEEVTGYRKLTRLISETSPDHQARLTVVRGGNDREINVTMGRREMPRFEAGNFGMTLPGNLNRVFEQIPMTPEVRVEQFPNGANGDVFVWRGEKDGGNFVFGSTRQIGVSVSGLTKQLGDYFGVADGKGILINNVAENSPAAKAGLKAGDVIVEIEGKPVAGTIDLLRGIGEKKEGEVALTIIRNRNRQTFSVTPEKMKEGEMPFRVFAQPNSRMRMQAIPRVRTSVPMRLRTLNRSL